MAPDEPPQVVVAGERLPSRDGLGVLHEPGGTVSRCQQRSLAALLQLRPQLPQAGLVVLFDLAPCILEPAARLLMLGVELGADVPFDSEDLCEGTLVHEAQAARGSGRPRASAGTGATPV